jgi:O-antigen ligase
MIILLLASMAFGNLGGSLQLCRVLTILFLPTLLANFNLRHEGLNNYWVFFVFLMGYSVLSLLWTPDIAEGMKQLIYFAIHFLFFFEILIFAKLAVNPADSITKGWMYSVMLTLVVALWEIFTDHHLQLSAFDSERAIHADGEVIKQRFAAVAFYNYNTYVTYLCFALPFIFYRVVNLTQISLKNLFPFIVILLAFFCVLCNASRGGLLTLVVMFAIFIYRQPRSYFKTLMLLLLIGGGVYVFIQYADMFLLAIIARSSDSGLVEDASRFAIWEVVIRTFMDTLGLGTGIGGINAGMAKFTSGITVPHNMFLEVLLEFGLFIFFCFTFFILNLYKKCFQETDKSVKTLLLIALVPLPLYAIIDSNYLLCYWVFAAFASLIYFTNKSFEEEYTDECD